MPGELPLFSNVDGRRAGRTGPTRSSSTPTQLESGEAHERRVQEASPPREIDEFKAEYRAALPRPRRRRARPTRTSCARCMNTVGKPGKLGEHVRCVVSVSMLTEGWDANTVTHILGVRAFGTQLLCEQVVGRGLRRAQLRRRTTTACSSPSTPRSTACRSVHPHRRGRRGAERRCEPSPACGRCPSERDLRDHLPARRRLPLRAVDRDHLEADFTTESRLALSTKDVPTETELDRHRRRDRDAHARRPSQAPRDAGGRVRRSPSGSSSSYFRDDGRRRSEPWLFPQLAPDRHAIGCDELRECSRTTPSPSCCCIHQHRRRRRRAASTARSCARNRGDTRLEAVLRPVRRRSARPRSSTSTRPRRSTTTSPTSATSARGRARLRLGGQGGRRASRRWTRWSRYVKNEGLGFAIPYTIDGQQRSYLPDFIVRIDDGHGDDDLLNLVVEVSGRAAGQGRRRSRPRRTCGSRRSTTTGGFGRWDVPRDHATRGTPKTEIRAVPAQPRRRSELMARAS